METFVHAIMQKLEPFGITLLMFLDYIFPLISSEPIMPLAGYLASREEMSVIIVILAGTAGSLLGTLAWYFIARCLGLGGVRNISACHGRWLTMPPGDIGAAAERFKNHERYLSWSDCSSQRYEP